MMNLSDLSDLSDKDKIKLGVAGGLLLLALILIYWFGIRTPPATNIAEQPPASVDGADGSAPAGNRRISPELAKQLEKQGK